MRRLATSAGAPRVGRRALMVGTVLALVVAGCIRDVGTPPGQDVAEAVGVNADGLAAVTGGDSGRAVYTHDPQGTWGHRGALPFMPTEAAAINAAGTVVGTAWTGGEIGTGPSQAVVSDPSGGVRLLPVTATAHSTAVDINDRGVVVGTITPTETGNLPSGYVHDPETGVTRLLGPPPDHGVAIPAAINGDGVVVGMTLLAGLAYRAAVVWAPPRYEPVLLPKPPGASLSDQPWPTGIDEDGTVVGWYFRPGTGGGIDGIRWAPAPDRTPTVLPGFLPEDIDGGTMVGRSTDASPEAMWWGAGRPGPRRLGRIEGGDSVATAIAGRHVVGWATAGPGGPRHVARYALPSTSSPADG